MKAEALAAFRRCCDAVSPFSCVDKALHLTNDHLIVNTSSSSMSFSLNRATRVILTAFGKASIPMALAAEQRLGRLISEGVVIAPSTLASTSPKLRSRVFFGARNNLPDADSVAATKAALRCIEQNDTVDTIYLYLISGGGSALFCAPDGISLETKLSVIRKLTANGADIRVLNAFRQKFSLVKGGKTLKFAKQGQVLALIISDIVGDPLQFIASGPTIPQTSSMMLASEAIVTSSRWASLLPEDVLQILKKPSPPATHHVQPFNVIIASNQHALVELNDYFTERGYESHIIRSGLEGNATEIGHLFGALISAGKTNFPGKLASFGGEPIFPKKDKVALLFGGETTVILRGQGRGGRCQEMTLACLTWLTSVSTSLPSFLFLSAGTDGQDGPTDAAGAFFTNADLENDLAKEGVSFLNASNSYEFWSLFNAGTNHIKTGPTGTNVMDVQIVLLHFKQT